MSLQIHMTGLGYEVVTSQVAGDRNWCYIHQLLAISEGADPKDVFSNRRYHVHHLSGVEWDNRPDNLVLQRNGDHANHHLNGASLS